jgi:chromosome segregation ATPase
MAPTDFQGPPGIDSPRPQTPQEDIDYVKEAFHSQYNWIAMAGASAFALLSGTFLPIILGAGLEMIYLAIVPQSSRFRRLIRSLKFAEEQKKHQEKLNDMLRNLPPEMESRYVHAAQVCASIRANFAQLSSASQIFLQQIDTSLQGLLTGYARLLLSSAQQNNYVKNNEQDGIKHEIAALQKALSTDPPKVQAINQKRIEILGKRLEKYDKISENRKVVDAQCSAVEDVLMLVRDQSVTMRDPQEVTDRLDSLVKDVEQTEQTVQQVEAIFSDMSPDLDGLMSLDGSSTTTGPNRVKMSN